MIASAATLFLDTPRSSLFGRPQKEAGPTWALAIFW